MDRQTAVVVGLAALSVVAVGLAAATLSSAVSGGAGEGSGGGTQGGVEMLPETDIGIEVGNPLLMQVIAVLTGVAMLSVYAYIVLEPRKVLYFALIFGGILVVTYLVLTLLQSGDPITPQEAVQPTVESGTAGNGSGGTETDTTRPDVPTTLLVMVLGVAGVALFAALAFFSDSLSGFGGSETEETTERTTDHAAELGAIAGRAADRIEAASEPGHNEVYRAWQEMVEHLDVADPKSTTPGEFERAAVDAGMQHEDVAALTRLFEDIRYGGYDPTDTREQQAREILRRIERRYGDN